MRDQFVIRAMREDDREVVVDLLWQLNLHEGELTDTRSGLREDAAACLAWNEDRIAAEEKGAHRVAEVGGGVVGYMCLIIQMAPPFVRADLRRHLYVAELVVDAEHRRGGIGKRLLADAESFARAHGLQHILIGLVAGNIGADALYASNGYDLYGYERLKRLG
jgi:GNAT superfamily N-acetyltransferase